MKFQEFWSYTLLELGGWSLTVRSLVYALGILLATRLVELGITSLLRRTQLLKRLGSQGGIHETWYRLIRAIFYTGGLLGALRMLGFRLGYFLQITLFKIPYKDADSEIKVVNVVIAVLIIVAARVGLWYFYSLFVRLGEAKRIPLDQGRRMAVYQIFKYLIYVLTLLLVLTNLQINLDLLVASSAALFVGIGFALQQSFSDVMSGMILLFEGTIEVGDIIVIDELNLAGRVKEIKLRTTIVETLDSISVIVPNSQFTSQNVINWNYNDRETRFRINVAVAYGSDVALVRKLLKQSAQSHGLVLKSPEPRVRFKNFGNSSLDFELLFWTARAPEYEDITSDIRFKIEADFRRHGVRIPFPQRSLHILSDYRFDQQQREKNAEPDEAPGSPDNDQPAERTDS